MSTTAVPPGVTLPQTKITAPPSRALPRFAALTLGFMILVILEGAVVRATGSGAGCGNHWPLCNGEVIPVHPRVATIIEFVHRQLTTVITLLVAALIVAIFRSFGHSQKQYPILRYTLWCLFGLVCEIVICRLLYTVGSFRLAIAIGLAYPVVTLPQVIRWTKLAKSREDLVCRAAVWSGILLVTEGALGAMLVKGGYVEANASNMRVFMQCIHFTNTMLLMAALTLTWFWLSPRPQLAASVKPALPIAWLAIATTILVGATGSVAALADTLFPSPSLVAGFAQDFAANAPLLIRMRWLHPAAALVGLACAIWLSLHLRNTLGKLVLALIAAQFVLGTADVLLLAPTWMQVLHLLGADIYWVALVAACSLILFPREELPA